MTDQQDVSSPSSLPLNNQRRLIKRLIIEGGIIFVVCAILAGGSIMLSDMADSEKRRSNQSETQTLQLNGQIETLETQMSEFKMALPISKQLLDEKGNPKYNLSRDQATAVFLELREKFAMKNATINISPVVESTENNLKKQQVQAISSKIAITMQAYSDEQVVKFVDGVMQGLPGIVSVDLFEMTRGTAYSLEDKEQDNNNNFKEPQIKARINFIWYGLKATPKDNTTPPGGPL